MRAILLIAVMVLGVGRAQTTPSAQDDPGPAVFGTTVVRPFGLRGDIYTLRAGTQRLPDFEKLEPIGAIYTSYLNIPPQNTFSLGFPGVERRYEWFAIDYNGRFYIDSPGKYEWALISDDGSKFYIDGRTVIDLDGLHPSQGTTAMVKLAGGVHTLRLSYFQGPCLNRVDPCVRLQLGVKPPGAPDFRFFSTDEFRPPANPADWKYGDPSQLVDLADPNSGRRNLKDVIQQKKDQ
jgi:hypothetical protein